MLKWYLDGPDISILRTSSEKLTFVLIECEAMPLGCCGMPAPIHMRFAACISCYRKAKRDHVKGSVYFLYRSFELCCCNIRSTTAELSVSLPAIFRRTFCVKTTDFRKLDGYLRDFCFIRCTTRDDSRRKSDTEPISHWKWDICQALQQG